MLDYTGGTCYTYSLWALKGFGEFRGEGSQTCQTTQVRHAIRTACGRFRVSLNSGENEVENVRLHRWDILYVQLVGAEGFP